MTHTNPARDVTSTPQNSNGPEHLYKELEAWAIGRDQAHRHRAMSSFVSSALLALFAYIYAVGITARFGLENSTFVTLPMAFVWLGLVLRMVFKIGYPLEVYGLIRHGWVKQALIGAGVALAMTGGLLLCKWALIHWVDGYQNLRLVDLSSSMGLSKLQLTLWVIFYVGIIAPFEELVRGGFQGVMQLLLDGNNPKLRANLIINFGYSAIHVHLSLGVALLVFPVGLVWGWLFARSGSIVGPLVSHTLLGALAFFIVGLP